MAAEVQKSLDEQIDLITQYLHDSMLEIHFISQNRSRRALSRIRNAMLLVALRRALGCARRLEKRLSSETKLELHEHSDATTNGERITGTGTEIPVGG
jgi:hypothetical protein